MSLEKRTEPRTLVDRFYSVEVSVGGLETAYQFKIRDLSQGGIGILIREDSELIEHIQVGSVIRMKYYPVESKAPVEMLDTEVKHITKNGASTIKGHVTVGLAIISDHPS